MRLARAQRLTGRARELGRAEARSAVRGRGVPGGSHVRPTRTTETGPRDARPHTGATSLQTCLVFSAPRPRPSKSPGIHRKNSGPPPSDPGVRASAGLGGGGGGLRQRGFFTVRGPCRREYCGAHITAQTLVCRWVRDWTPTVDCGSTNCVCSRTAGKLESLRPNARDRKF